MIAASSILLTNFVFGISPTWNQNLQALSGGYRSTDLKSCCCLIFYRLKQNLTQEKKTSAIFEKYSSLGFFFVANHDYVNQLIQRYEFLPETLFRTL